jgi:hypothetical protein
VAGVLRPYSQLARQLLFPCWLVCATLAFRLHGWRERAALWAAVVVLGVGIVPAMLRIVSPDRLAAARGAVLEARGLISFADALVNPQGDTLVRLDFSHVTRGACVTPRQEPALPLPASQRRNVILLSIDAMRRDALGTRIGHRAVAPHLEAFEHESLSFTRATAPAAITLLSLSSALTGRSLQQLLWQRSVPPNVFTATRKLLPVQRIFLPSWSIFKATSFTTLLTRGVSTHHRRRKEDAAAVFIDALDQARASHERGLFWMHLGDPHLPYAAHKGFQFGRSAVERYYSEVAYDDAIVGRVLDHLRDNGWLQDSLVIVFADHGEALGERGGYFGHGTQLVGRFTDVPLIVHYPNVTPSVSITPVILTQLAPTILHYLDQPLPRGVAACSLLHVGPASAQCLPPITMIYGVPTETFAKILKHPVRSLADAERRQDELIAWRRFTPSLAAISSDRRYVRDLSTGVERVYRFPDRSNERENLASSEPGTLGEFRAKVAAFRRDEAQRIACEFATP